MRGDIVDANDGNARERADDIRGDRRGQPLARAARYELADERLAGNAEEDGKSQSDDFLEPGKDCEILFECLSEADAGMAALFEKGIRRDVDHGHDQRTLAERQCRTARVEDSGR